MPRSPLSLHTPHEVARLLAGRVRELRLARGWKQSTLAEHAGVSLPTLRRYERHGRTSVDHLLRICHALGRLDEVAEILKPPPAQSIAELEARLKVETPKRKRGVR